MVTFNRLEFLKKTVNSIYHRTKWPYRLIVVDNNSTDGTQAWLKHAKLTGFISEHVFLNENKGLATGLSEGFKLVKSEYFITTQDDLLPPDLEPCWLERMLELFKKYEKDYAGISMRVQRIRHREVDEYRDIIESPNSLASVFRVQKKTEIDKIGGFGHRPHWESTAFSDRTRSLKKKLAVATYLYADHTGFMFENKGFEPGFTSYHTYSPERVKQGEEQPYPEIDSKTNVPLRLITNRDLPEHQKRLEVWNRWGFKKSAVMLENLRSRHDEKIKYNGIQMNEFVHLLYTLARDTVNVGTIVEIGLGWGASTNAFLYGLHDRHKNPKNRKLYSIDIEDRVKQAQVDMDISYMWEFIKTDSTKYKWEKEPIDILLIDGDHSYEAVKADYDNFYPHVRSGGIVLLHDVSWENKGVKRFYEEIGCPGIILTNSPSGMALFSKK